MPLQNTITTSFKLQGTGIHSGKACSIHAHPQEAGVGRVFLVNGTPIPAHADYVTNTTRSTTLAKDSSTVSTVEHLLSALAGCDVDNVLVEVEGPEIPILDGSALPFIEAILSAGITALPGTEAKTVSLDAPVSLKLGDSLLVATPADSFKPTILVYFDEWHEGSVFFSIDATDFHKEYLTKVAPARTFAFAREVEMLRAAGLAQGGSLDNALIITPPDEFSSPLRVPKEWAAHKLLDVIGDLALLDARLQFELDAIRPGHRINTAFAKLLTSRLTESG